MLAFVFSGIYQFPSQLHAQPSAFLRVGRFAATNLGAVAGSGEKTVEVETPSRFQSGSWSLGGGGSPGPGDLSGAGGDVDEI